MTHKIRSRPEKRVGGGGFGHYKSMNKTDDKKRKFRQVDRNQVNKKKFERWIIWFQFLKLFHIVLVYTNKFEVKKFFLFYNSEYDSIYFPIKEELNIEMNCYLFK